MRRLAVLLGFVLLTFVPGLLAGRIGHVARGYAAPDGTFSFRGGIEADDHGPESPVEVVLDVVRSTFEARLGGPVQAGSLHVEISWERSWFDVDGKRHPGPRGSLADEATHLTIGDAEGRVAGPSAAMSMARGPAVREGGCGLGREGRARHVIRFRRDGHPYTLTVEVWSTRRGNRIVTIDEGEGT